MTQASKRSGEAGHVLSVRVYYEDTDAAGIVYYANYLHFAERARTELLRSLGFARTDRTHGVAFAVRSCAVDYLAPARLDDWLDIETQLVNLQGASLEVAQTIRRDGKTLVHLTVRMACMDGDGKVTRMPTELREALKAGLSRSPFKVGASKVHTSKTRRSA